MKEKLVYLDYLEKNYTNKFRYVENVSLLENICETKAKKYCSKLNCKYITILCQKYPEKLKRINKPPIVLYYIGNIDLINSQQIAIIGSRYNSDYGKAVTKQLISQIKGYVITSGYAYGIDQLAHYYALENNLKTVAVLGGGFNYIYPNNNNELVKKIKESSLLLSEYSPFEKPKPWNFLMRNRIIATLSEKIIVIEATEKSGSLKTVEVALEQNKEIYSVPGSIFSTKSSGTNLLIEEGANVITKDTNFTNEKDKN